MTAQPTCVEPVVALVVAAGSGSRLGGDVPKPLRVVRGRTLLERSIAQLAAGGCTDAVVVIPDGLQDDFAATLVNATIPVQFCVGGAERQDSVLNGLAAIEADPTLKGSGVVLVHDAARAFVPAAVVTRVIEAVQRGATAVTPVTEVVDSIRQVSQSGSTVVDRSGLRAVQTPQGFDRVALVAAHERIKADQVVVTDDASVCEYAGYEVTLVDGAREAFKVTTPFDLVVAEALAAAEEYGCFE